MSGMEDLIARSRSPGTFVERREFTLSREKAVDKLREFSLRHPAGYVLELVQAAVFAGATYIAIDVSDTAVLVAWVGGRACTAAQLENIFDHLFLARTDPATRHLSQLAIGLNALLQREPKLVRIESGDGTVEGTVRVDLDRNGGGALGRPQQPMAGTYLLVQLRTGWLDRFDGPEFHAEEALVESRCVHSPVPILLNGRAPFGYRPSTQLHMFGTEDEQSFQQDGARGVVAIPGVRERATSSRSPIGVRLVVGGVWITTMDLPVLGRAPGGVPLVGVLCDDRLRKTADQSDIVQDSAFVRLLHMAQPHATTLIRRSAGESWKPPGLPPIPHEAPVGEQVVAGPAPEALPIPIGQLGVRPVVSPGELSGLPAGTRLFWCRPEDAVQIEASADPSRFPFPVLQLSAGQARTLAAECPGLSLAPLASPADVEFVHNALERRREVGRLEASFHHRGVQLGLALRLDLAGCADAIRAEPGEIPLSVGAASRSAWCGALELDLPGVSVHLVAAGDEPELALREAVAERVVAEAWRWLLPGPQQIPGDGPELRDLRCALLRESLRPLFVEGPSGVTLEPILLGLTPGQSLAVMELPLADAVDGALTLRRLLEAQGSQAVIQLASEAERSRLAPLEAMLGWGHLAAGQDDALPVCCVGCSAGGWHAMSRRELAWESYGHILFVPRSFRTPPQLAQWARRSTALPIIGLVSAPGAPDNIGWSEGLRLLTQELRRLERTKDWEELACDGSIASQSMAMGVMALSILEAIPKSGAEALWETPSAASSPVQDHPPVVPVGGALPLGQDTMALSFDHLRALERVLPPGSLRLYLDDGPEGYGWGGDPVGWVARREVRGAGLEGWIGLRAPFDPTAGVLLHSSRTLHALYDGEQSLPVHGLVSLPPGSSFPSEDQEELLMLERLLLYQGLASLLGGGEIRGEQREAARHYAAAFAIDAWRRGRLDRGGARELAMAVPCAPYGSLYDWLSLGERGPRPGSLHPVLARLAKAGPIAAGQTRGGREDLEQRFQRALGYDHELEVALDLQYLEDPAERVRLVERGRSSGPVLLLNLRNTMVTRVVDGGGYGFGLDGPTRDSRSDRDLQRARSLLLLEMAWRLVRWARKRGHTLELHAIHRVLLAANLDG